MTCRLCLTRTEFCISLKNAKTQDEDEELEDMAGIIEKHFDLYLDVNSDLVCTVCWQQIKDFHLFYLFIEEKQNQITHQSQFPALTSTKIEPKLTEYEHELITKDAAADEMLLTNEFIINTQNISIVPEPGGQWNKADNSQEATENLEDIKNVELIDQVSENTLSQSNEVRSPQEATENLEDVKNVELIDQADRTNVMAAKTDYVYDAEMRDDVHDDEVDIKNESITDTSSAMIMENSLSQWNKVANPQEETENRPTLRNADLIDTVNVEQSRNSTNASGNSNDVSVTTGVLETETLRKEESIENIQQNLDHRNQRKNFALKCDLCAQTLDNFDKLKQHFKDQHNCKGYIRCCNKQYSCSQYYADHLEWHLNPNLWKCGTCDRVYDCRVSYEFHLSTTHEVAENFKFRCTICPAKFTQEYLLHHHEKDYHSDQELKCDKCKKGFHNLESLECHQQLQHQEMKCDECNKELKSVKNLKEHKRRIHLGAEKTECDICGKIFLTLYQCKLHKGAVHQEAAALNFQCPHCPKKFILKGVLNLHMKAVHCKQKMKCDQCKKGFWNLESLECHQQLQHQEMKCDECNKELKSVKNLKEHKRRIHLGADRTACDICGKIFRSRYNYKIHKARAHPEAVNLNFQCPHCPKKFATLAFLKMHMKKNNCTQNPNCSDGDQKHKCDECNKEFKSDYTLAVHKRKIHLGTYRTACDICGKIFKTPTACKIHKGGAHPEAVSLNFQCSHCPKKFAMMSVLTQHEKRVHGVQKLKSKPNPPLRKSKRYELDKEAGHKDTEDTHTQTEKNSV